MCGLVCVLALDGRPVEAGDLHRMSETIIHRGPDDSGIFREGAVGFGFRRLSILDLTPSGHQPMVSADGALVLVFNGEIYNYVELRSELTALGHEFRSSGDTEVLLHAYAEWGRDCLSRLNGMWAFLIYDRRRDVVFGSRDRFGVKPLYRYRGRDALLFASEIKALKASRHYGEDHTNWPVAARFLLDGTIDDTAATFSAGVEQVPAGSAFEIGRDGTCSEWTYWSLDELEPQAGAAPDEAYRTIFEDSVRLRLRSDVPVGVCLSGGLDSTSIICHMARENAKADPDGQQPIHAFCFMDPNFDESAYINDTLAQTSAMLHKAEADPEALWSTLAEILWYQDEPVHSAFVLAAYELMRLAASNGITVVINGQGSDETCAGYTSYFKTFWLSLMRSGRMVEAWRQMSSFAEKHDRKLGDILSEQSVAFLRGLLRESAAYRGLSQARRTRQGRLHPWFSGDLTRHYEADAGSDRPFSLGAALRGSVGVSPLPLYLRVEDRLSMAHSLESRLPFMDYRLVSHLFTLPDSWKLRDGLNKYVLRQAMRGRIPESVRARVDKMGFPIPIERWMAGAFHEPVQDILASRATRERGIYDVDAIRKDLALHREGRGRADVAVELFRVVQFEIWNEQRITPFQQSRVLVGA